ncbi:MAG TPA: PaaI family thioesterase [Desulfobulbaceae bacterium]|nr:PaaI family thioesterase [Desulfobulbaceae bacterium]
MRTLNPEYAAAVGKVVNASPYPHLLSMKLVRLEIGACELTIEVQPKHFQPFGLVHGGVLATLIDTATFWAIFSEIDEDKGLTSVDLKLNYLAPVTSGTLTAKGKRIKTGRTLSLSEAEISNENGKILAYGLSTLMTLPSSNLLPTDMPLPNKFLP